MSGAFYFADGKAVVVTGRKKGILFVRIRDINYLLEEIYTTPKLNCLLS